MTTTEKEGVGKATQNTKLDQDILQLIKDSWSGTGLEGLLSFEDKLSDKEKKLTPSEIALIIDRIKKDIQNPEFLSFESGKKDDQDYGFEGVWNDVIPTLSPNGDCIIPVNFWYDNQRRTILLVLEVSADGEENVYRLPEWDNHYTLKVNQIEFTYQLVEEGEKFKMKIKN